MDEELYFIFDDIETCECIGEFEEEYVYDIEMDDDTHTFIANDILVHNSLYISYENLLSTIKGIENFNQRQKLELIVGINEKFLNQYNKQYMKEYYESRFVKSIHDFELETVALSGLWLNVKKRYCQILLWKDGKYFDADSLPMKIKGLEMIKSSYPKFDREALKSVVRSILESGDNENLWEKTNILVQQQKQKHNEADIETICAATGVNGYTKYVIEQPIEYEDASDIQVLDKNNKAILYTRAKCPANVRALASYNTIRDAYGLKGEPIYGGKVKVYEFKPPYQTKNKSPFMFAFQSKNYPKWADEYAPIDRNAMFQKYFLDPLNRICKDSLGFNPFQLDGSKQVSLFDMLF